MAGALARQQAFTMFSFALVLAGLFWLLGQLLPPDSAVAAVTSYLAFTNLLLAGFNIVPGFPLDGGRVLRSIVWGATGNLPRATRIASYVGQAVAFGMIAWGVSRLLGGDVFGGLWTAFIGWFLNSGAEASRQQQTVRAVLDGVPVTTVMDTSPAVAEPSLNVHDFVFEHTLRHGHRALPVDEGGWQGPAPFQWGQRERQPRRTMDRRGAQSRDPCDDRTRVLF